MPAKRKKQLEWSRSAARDLLHIEDYIAKDNQIAADAVVAYIRQGTLLLESDPLIGKRRLTSPYRELVLTRFPFSIVYRVRGNSVFIVRVLHQRMMFP